MDPGCNNFPYPDGCASNHEKFEQNGIQANFTWDINDTTTFNYIYGYVDFNYDFNYDIDATYSEFSQWRSTVREDVHMSTHEININWEIDSPLGYWEVTSGAFFMDENRNQTYGLHNSTPGLQNAANYGVLDTTFGTLLAYTGIDLTAYGATNSVMGLLGCTGYLGCWDDAEHADFDNVLEGYSGSGRWNGMANGAAYRHDNNVQNDAFAVYTQGTLRINDDFSLVLGVRYAEDDKAVIEKRHGYSELYANALAAFLPAMNLLAGAPYIPLEGSADAAAYGVQGITALAATNIATGAATVAFDPVLVATYAQYFALGLTPSDLSYSMFTVDYEKQINPTCEVTATECATPLRVYQGIPYSYNRLVTDDDTWSDTNIRVNLDWTPRDNILMYLGLTTGYRSGGYALGSTGNVQTQRDEFGVEVSTGEQELLDYDQEEVRAIELGYKGIHLDDTLQLFWSIYHYDYDGYQDEITQYDPVRNTSVSWASNADGITNQGFEMDLTWAATDRLTLNMNYSYTETEYGEDYEVFTVDDPVNPVPVFGLCTQGYVGCTVDDPSFAEDYTVNLKGGPLKGIPEEKFTIRVTYEMDTRFGPMWFLVNHSYTGDFSASGVQRALDRVESRENTNVSLSWYSNDGATSIRAYVNNLMDNENYYALSTGDHETNYRKSVTPLSPRTMGVDVRYRF